MVLIGHAASEKKMFEVVKGRTDDDDGRTSEHGYTISSLGESSAQVG